MVVVFLVKAEAHALYVEKNIVIPLLLLLPERHKEYLRQEGQRRQKERASKVEEEETKIVEKTDEDLWERLDRLEQQEKQGQELEL